MSEKRDKIIETATNMIRSGGYNAFSFREIADYVGIKSSSVHHYFRRKEDLAEIVADRYSEAFLEALESEKKGFKEDAEVIAHYGNLFESAFASSGKACLCGILSHESPALPHPVICKVSEFVDLNVKWLAAELTKINPDRPEQQIISKARMIYTSLSGAMAVATLKNDSSWIKSVQNTLCQS